MFMRSILSGGILFREFDGYQWWNYIVFMAGTVIIFFGVYQLSPRDSSRNQLNAELVQLDSVEALPSSNGSVQNEHRTNMDDNHFPHEMDTNLTLSPEDIERLTLHGISRSQSEQNTSEPVDLPRIRENIMELESLTDGDQSSYAPSRSVYSLRNSGPDPEITEIHNRRPEMSINTSLAPPPTPVLQHSSLSLRAIHKIFATSGRMLSIFMICYLILLHLSLKK